jgi:outer membrane lipoprotein SlyB
MKRTLKVIDLTLIISLLTALQGCPMTGCASMSKFSPEQVQSIRDVSKAMNDAAREGNVTGYARIHLGPLRARLVQGVELEGVEGDIFLFANPAAQQTPAESANATQPN